MESILKEEATGFANRLDVECEKKVPRMISRFGDGEILAVRGTIYRNQGRWGKNGCEREKPRVILGTLNLRSLLSC